MLPSLPEKLFLVTSSIWLLKPEAHEPSSPNLASSSTLSGLLILSLKCFPLPPCSPAALPPQLSHLSSAITNSHLDHNKEPSPQVPLAARFQSRFCIFSGKPHELNPHILFLIKWALSDYQNRYHVTEQHRTHRKPEAVPDLWHSGCRRGGDNTGY